MQVTKMGWLSWKQDREKLSNEPHEIYYARKLAKKLLKDIEDLDSRDTFIVKVGKIKRICELALKK